MQVILLAIILAAPVPHFDQATHDRVEVAMWTELQAQRDQIEIMWLPSRRLVKTYEKAYQCYVRYHLYKVSDCDRERTALTEKLKAERK